MDIKSQLQSDISTLTILDLWYAAHGGTRVNFSHAQVVDDFESDDWLLQKMALVAKLVLDEGAFRSRGPLRGLLVRECDPYYVCVGFHNSAQRLHVSVLLKEEHGDSNS